jgi:hypothetical protein
MGALLPDPSAPENDQKYKYNFIGCQQHTDFTTKTFYYLKKLEVL